MRREFPRKIRLLGLPAPISGEQQPFEGQMHAGAAASSFEVASFALCPCWLVFAGKESEREAAPSRGLTPPCQYQTWGVVLKR